MRRINDWLYAHPRLWSVLVGVAVVGFLVSLPAWAPWWLTHLTYWLVTDGR